MQICLCWAGEFPQIDWLVPFHFIVSRVLCKLDPVLPTLYRRAEVRCASQAQSGLTGFA